MRNLLLALALALPLYGQLDTTVVPWTEDLSEPAIWHGDKCADGDERHFYDGCNRCDCVGDICTCTLLGCATVGMDPIIYDPETKPESPKEPMRGFIRRLLQWLW